MNQYGMSFRVLKAAHVLLLWPIESMGLAYLPTFNHKNQTNVGKYTIRGSYGWCFKYLFGD